MAVINFYDDILDTPTLTKEVEGKNVLKDLVQKYIDEKADDTQTVEVYHADTDTTEFIKVVPESYKIISIVNGEEVELDTEITGDVIVTVIFVPQSKQAWGVVSVIAGIALMMTGIGLGLGGWFASTGLALGALGIMGAGAGLIAVGVLLNKRMVILQKNLIRILKIFHTYLVLKIKVLLDRNIRSS